MSWRRLLIALVVGLLVAASCGGGSDDGGAADGGSDGGNAGGGAGERGRGGREPVDFFGDEESGIGAELAAARAESPDGLLPTDVALDLFSSIYGEVPGGEPRFEEVRTGDASLAIRAVGARWEELDESARAAIQEALRSENGEAQTTSTDPPMAGGPGRQLAAAGGSDLSEVSARVERLRAKLREQVEFMPVKQIETRLVPGSTWTAVGRDAAADAAPMRGGDVTWVGDYDRCQIRVNEDVPLTDTTLAHEVFHCFQYEMAPLESVDETPDWVFEGGAEWAAATVAGSDAFTRDTFGAWQQTGRSLYLLDYPAVGYFWTIETMGINPWTDIPRMIASENRGHDLHHVVLDRKELVSRLGTGAFMKSVDGASVDEIWDLTAKAVPQEFRPSFTVSRGSPREFSGRAHSGFMRTEAHQINVDGNALDVELTGEVGAVQEVGGALETFEGEYSNRFCFEEGSARIVFLNLAFVEPGPISVKLSVPNDDEDCEVEVCGGPHPSAEAAAAACLEGAQLVGEGDGLKVYGGGIPEGQHFFEKQGSSWYLVCVRRSSGCDDDRDRVARWCCDEDGQWYAVE